MPKIETNTSSGPFRKVRTTEEAKVACYSVKIYQKHKTEFGISDI